MPFFAPWLQAPNVLQAAESGTRAGISRNQMVQDALEHAKQLQLQRDELNQRAQQAADALGQAGGLRAHELNIQENQDAAANQLRQQALKQQGLYQNERANNYANAVDARTALDKARENSLNNHKQFFNTGGGLFQVDEKGNPVLVAGSGKPAPTAYQTETTLTPAKDADITPASSGSWNPFNWGAGAHPAITNSPAILPMKIERKIPIPNSTAGSAGSLLQLPSSQIPASNGAIPQSHIQNLLAHPETAHYFDDVYGQGASSQYLNQADSGPTADEPAASVLETPPDTE